MADRTDVLTVVVTNAHKPTKNKTVIVDLAAHDDACLTVGHNGELWIQGAEDGELKVLLTDADFTGLIVSRVVTEATEDAPVESDAAPVEEPA